MKFWTLFILQNLFIFMNIFWNSKHFNFGGIFNILTIFKVHDCFWIFKSIFNSKKTKWKINAQKNGKLARKMHIWVIPMTPYAWKRNSEIPIRRSLHRTVDTNAQFKKCSKIPNLLCIFFFFFPFLVCFSLSYFLFLLIVKFRKLLKCSNFVCIYFNFLFCIFQKLYDVS